MDSSVVAHKLLDFMSAHGGQVRLNERDFADFCHHIRDVWDDGFCAGESKQAILEIRARERFLSELKSKGTT